MWEEEEGRAVDLLGRDGLLCGDSLRVDGEEEQRRTVWWTTLKLEVQRIPRQERKIRGLAGCTSNRCVCNQRKKFKGQ